MPEETTKMSLALVQLGQNFKQMGESLDNMGKALYNVGNDLYAMKAQIDELAKEFPEASDRAKKRIDEWMAKKRPF